MQRHCSTATKLSVTWRRQKSITNNLDDFAACWKIDPVIMNGVASNVIISCTHRGMHNLVTRIENIIPMIMLY